MKCLNPNCKRGEIIQGQYGAEGDDAFKERMASGYCSKRCKRLSTPAKPDRPPSTLSLLHPPNYKVEDKEPRWKETPERDVNYLKWIRSLPCLICGGKSDAHHQNKRKNGGKSTTASDYRALPLCDMHHLGGGTDALPGSYHGLAGLTGWRFWEFYRVDVESTINRLNQEYNEMLSRRTK